MDKLSQRARRKKRIRKKVFGKKERPRVSVFRSNRHIYVQVIDDDSQITLASSSDLNLSKNQRKGTKVEITTLVGKKLGEQLQKKKIKKVVFDRSGYRYQGRVKALAEALREAGINF